MNEHDNLTPAELESYRSALKEAYPAPKSDIHGNVMKQIRAERLMQKKRARRAAFVKWGSVAACLLLVCVIALKVIPDADILAPMAENNSGMGMEADLGVARCYSGISEEAEQNKAQAEDYVVSDEELYTHFYGVNGDIEANLSVDKSTPSEVINDMMHQQSNGMKNEAADDCDVPEAEPVADKLTENVTTEAPQVDAPETEEETETEAPETEAAEETR